MRVAALNSDGVIVGVADVDDTFWSDSQPDIQAAATARGLSTMTLDPNEGSPTMNVSNLGGWDSFLALAGSSDSSAAPPQTAMAAASPASPGVSTAVAAAAVGVAAAAVVMGLFKGPLWAGIVVGSAGALLAKVAVDSAVES
jgi:hypothetical protein